MSTAERRLARRPLRRQGGYTFLEMSITMVIVALMSLVVERVLSSTQDAEKYLGAVRLTTERGQRIAYDVREIVSASRNSTAATPWGWRTWLRWTAPAIRRRRAPACRCSTR